MADKKKPRVPSPAYARNNHRRQSRGCGERNLEYRYLTYDSQEMLFEIDRPDRVPPDHLEGLGSYYRLTECMGECSNIPSLLRIGAFVSARYHRGGMSPWTERSNFELPGPYPASWGPGALGLS